MFVPANGKASWPDPSSSANSYYLVALPACRLMCPAPGSGEWMRRLPRSDSDTEVERPATALPSLGTLPGRQRQKTGSESKSPRRGWKNQQVLGVVSMRPNSDMPLWGQLQETALFSVVTL